MAAVFADVWEVISERIEQLDEFEKFARSNAKNWVDLEASFKALIGQAPQYGSKAIEKADSDRALLSSLLTPDAVRGALEPLIFELANSEFKSVEPDVFGIMRDLREYMDTNDLTIRSRGFTFGTPTFVGSLGARGAINRLTVDEFGWPLEATAAEAKSAKCTLDQNQVDEHTEVFTFYGAPANKDYLKVEGSNIRAEVVALHAGITATYCQNPSFSDHGATLAGGEGALPSATALPGWTIAAGSYADLRANTTTVYRGFPGDETPTSLRWMGNATIRQILQETQRPQFLPDTPYYFQVAVYRAASATGQLVFTVGAASVTVDISTLSDNAWNVVRIALGTSNWLRGFNAADLKVELALTSLATGTIYTDDLIIGPMTNVDGTFYAPVGGATPFTRLDSFTWTDSENATRAKNSYWLWRAGLGHAPAAANATQITASGGRTLTFANSGSADTITASSGSFISDGYKPGMLVTIAGSASNNLTTGPIATVTATVLTFGSGTSLTNEGPVSATTTLDATAPIADGS